MEITLTQNMKVVSAIPSTIGGGVAVMGTGISLKYVHRLFIIVNYEDGGAGDAVALYRDTDVGGGTADAGLIVNNVKLWTNADIATSDTLVRQADNTFHLFDDSNLDQMAVFDVDPVTLGLTANNVEYDCIAVGFPALSVFSTASATYVAFTRYPQATPPSIIEN